MGNKSARKAHDDPINAASAGLAALGLERSRRAGVLEVLAALLDHADPGGAVVLDRALFEREETIGVDTCLDAYALLEQLGIVRRTDYGWVIAAYAQHQGPSGETQASLAVLHRHIATASDNAPAVGVPPVARGAQIRTWRRAVPLAAGLAASATMFAGVTHISPQAAVSGRHAVTSSLKAAAPLPGESAPPGAGSEAAKGKPGPDVARTAASQVPVPGVAPAPSPPCAAQAVVAAVRSVDVVRTPANALGAVAWAAVVEGTVTPLDPATSTEPSLQVVVDVGGRSTEPVPASVAAPGAVPGQPRPFTAVVALGATRPAAAVTASAAVAAPGC